MNTQPTHTPWDELSRSYLEIEAAGAAFPLSENYLPQAGARVLDLGCGVGTHMRIFRSRTAHVIGIDLSFAMAKEAARVAPVAQANSLALPFADGSFDYLWSRVVISCVPDWKAAINEALRVVSAGGVLVLLVSNKWSVMTPFRTLLSRLGFYSEGYIRHLSRADFSRLAHKSGFRITAAFAVQKPARSRNPLFLLGAKVFYLMDRAIAALFPRWGGDLCVVLERL